MVVSSKWPFLFPGDLLSPLFLDHRQNLIWWYLELLLFSQRWRQWIWSLQGNTNWDELGCWMFDMRTWEWKWSDWRNRSSGVPGQIWDQSGRTFMQITLTEHLDSCVICSSPSWQTYFQTGHLLACMSSGCQSHWKAFYVLCSCETGVWTGSQHECLWKVHLSCSLIPQKCVAIPTFCPSVPSLFSSLSSSSAFWLWVLFFSAGFQLSHRQLEEVTDWSIEFFFISVMLPWTNISNSLVFFSRTKH